MTSRVRARLVDTDRVTPRIRRLVFGGPDLPRLRPPDGALGPYLKLHVPCPGGGHRVRTYSVRRFDPDRNELTVDIVLHAGETAGPTFAASASVGDMIEISGPGFIPAEGVRTYVLAGDQTALPAIANILETLPASAHATALIEVPDAGEEQPLPSRAILDLVWLHRPPGQPSRLAEAVCAISPAQTGDLLVWAGAEATIARAIRRHARGACGVPASRCQVLNYWKAGEPEGGFSYIA